MSNARDNIEFMLNKFKLERYFYIIATGASVILLGICIVSLMFRDLDKSVTKILIMFGPTGMITYSCSRILKMWSDCLELFKEEK